jgi:hypothetical protein
MYAKIETERLLYIKLNQTKLRSEECIHLRDAIINDGNVNPNDVGKMIILPTTFAGRKTWTPCKCSIHTCLSIHTCALDSKAHV